MTLPPPIAAHRVLGDGRSAALLRPVGEIDWWCAPAFDDPPVLWSLLDPDGAAARWCDVRPVEWRGGLAGPVATTVVHTGRTRVEVRDRLDGPRIVRLARALDGPLDVRHETTLGGFDAPRRPAVTSRLTAPQGRWAGLVVTPDGVDAASDVDALLAAWRRSAAGEERRGTGTWLPRPFPERSADGLAVLRACTFAATGAVIAAPTTSLPEAPGHDRQFDYRYTWLRDASLAASVAALLGDAAQSDAHLSFLTRQAGEARVPSGPMTTIRGDTVPDEREVPGVAGWAGSRPVRVGNGAKEQLQFDALGSLAESVSLSLQMGAPLGDELWRLLSEIADRVVDEPDGPSSGIWELRRPRRLVSGDIGRWLALDRAVWVGRLWRPTAWRRRRRWKQARDDARSRVLAVLEPDGRLPQCYDERDRTDASALLAVMFGLLGRRDRRASLVIDAVVRDLGAGPFVHRYEPGGDDGFSGVEGAFVPASWWVVSALAIVGRVDEARARAEALHGALPRLLAEEADPATGEGLGNTPLVWSHMEAARALYLLHVAEIRARWTSLGLGVWRLQRYLRSRGIRRRRRSLHGER